MNEKPDKDSELFWNAMRDVTRLKPHNLVQRRSGHPQNGTSQESPSPRERNADDEETTFVRPGMRQTVLRRLRNGDILIEDELDLHGRTVVEAEQQLRVFLRQSQATARQRAIRVIHGKGLGSRNQKPVLKAKVLEYLRQSEAVLAFCAAAPAEGGSGAVHILLKRR